MAESTIPKQDNLALTITTPLGKNAFVLNNLRGEEQLSGLFHYTLELESDKSDQDFDKIVGKNATVAIRLDDRKSYRYIHGVVTRFIQAGSETRQTTINGKRQQETYTIYYAELRPWLWLLTLTLDCRIFQNKTVPEIIEDVCTTFGFTVDRTNLGTDYAQREYCVQYQESAFDFLSRLMEDEGIFYFFEHDETTHTLVLADDVSALAPKDVPVVHMNEKGDKGVITACTLEQQVAPDAYASGDFSFETPSTKLLASVQGQGGSGKRRIYEYPGGYRSTSAGEKKANLRFAAHELPAKKLLRGDGHCREFRAGYRFQLMKHQRSDMNTTYIVYWLSLSANQSYYTNTFSAFPADVSFRPPRLTPRPCITGTQTAVVVGKSGEEIATDKYGRVKVQFHWDQQGKQDENSSCWVRVAQAWAGKGWGTLFTPRIGHEVVVSFLNGDPDCPLITGAVYNAEQTVPYTLPTEQTKSTIKTNSSKGGGGFNELRFEDKKDAEEIFVHAQKDLNTTVLNDATTTIKNNRTVTVQEADDTLVVDKGNRTVQVNTGNETHEVKGTRSVTVTGNETHTNQANFSQEVTGNCTWKITGNLMIDVQGNVIIKSGGSLVNKAGTTITNDAGVTLLNKAGASLINRASGSLINAGGGVQLIGAAGMVVIGAGLVKIDPANPT